MDATLKEKWVAALRSGNYRQGKHHLRRQNAYCCLGVLCDVQGYQWELQEDIHNLETGVYLPKNPIHQQVHSACYLPYELQQEARLSMEQQEVLTKMNDSHNRNFTEIATYIERNF